MFQWNKEISELLQQVDLLRNYTYQLLLASNEIDDKRARYYFNLIQKTLSQVDGIITKIKRLDDLFDKNTANKKD